MTSEEPGTSASAADNSVPGPGRASTAADVSNLEREKDIAQARSQLVQGAISNKTAETRAKFGAGTVTGSTLTGNVTTTVQSGSFESSVLAAKSVNEAAEIISKRIDPKLPYIIFTGSQKPNFADLRIFEAQECTVRMLYNNASAQVNTVKVDATQQLLPGAPIAVTTAAAGATAEIIAKLGSYFQSEYNVQNSSVSGVDADLLAISLASKLTNTLYPARWALPSGESLKEILRELVTLRGWGAQQLSRIDRLREHINAADEAQFDPGKKADDVASKYLSVSESLKEANKSYDDLIASLIELDASGVPRIARLIEQRAIFDKMQSGSCALLVQIAGVGGTSYTQKNLWTFFGSMPFFVSGGAIATYLVVDKEGLVKSAGNLPVHTGFMKVLGIPEKLRHLRSAFAQRSKSVDRELGEEGRV